MKMMKKNWRFFWIASAVFWAVFCLGCAALMGFSKPAAAMLGAVSVLAWGYSLLHFRSIRYETENGDIKITVGIFIKSTKIIRKNSILYESRIALGGRVLCLMIHTAGGKVTLFCDKMKLF